VRVRRAALGMRPRSGPCAQTHQVGALGLRVRRGPGGGPRAGRLRGLARAARSGRRLVQRTHVQRPRFTGAQGGWRWLRRRWSLNRRGGAPCAAHGAPPPRLTPPPDRRPGHRAPSARGARMARGSDPGRGGGCGDGARVRRTRHLQLAWRAPAPHTPWPHAQRGSATRGGPRSSSCVRSGRATVALP